MCNNVQNYHHLLGRKYRSLVFKFGTETTVAHFPLSKPFTFLLGKNTHYLQKFTRAACLRSLPHQKKWKSQMENDCKVVQFPWKGRECRNRILNTNTDLIWNVKWKFNNLCGNVLNNSSIFVNLKIIFNTNGKVQIIIFIITFIVNFTFRQIRWPWLTIKVIISFTLPFLVHLSIKTVKTDVPTVAGRERCHCYYIKKSSCA